MPNELLFYFRGWTMTAQGQRRSFQLPQSQFPTKTHWCNCMNNLLAPPAVASPSASGCSISASVPPPPPPPKKKKKRERSRVRACQSHPHGLLGTRKWTTGDRTVIWVCVEVGDLLNVCIVLGFPPPVNTHEQGGFEKSISRYSTFGS